MSDESDQDADRQRQDGDERAARVQEKHDAHQRDDQLSSISVRESGDGALDEPGAVVGRDDETPSGSAGCDSTSALDADHGGVRAVALHDDPAGRFALAVEFADAAPLSGPSWTRATSGGASACRPRALSDDLLEILDAAT